MKNQTIMQKLGYSSSEAKVYLTVLKLGEAHISHIARKLKLPRSSTNLILERLREDGLVDCFVMRRRRYWVPEDPMHLLKRIKHHEELIETIMPNLTHMRKKAKKRLQHINKIEEIGALREFADGMQQPVLIANQEAVIRYVNLPWEEYFGYTLDEVVGENTAILNSGKTKHAEHKQLWDTLEKKRLFQSEAFIDRKKDGTFFPFFTIIFPIYYRNRIFYIQIIDTASRTND